MAGRPRKPTAVLESKGAFKKDPQRKAARENEPPPNGDIGAPPDYFDQAHAAIWHELCDEAAPGVLAKSDRKLMEIAVRLTRKMRVMPGRSPRWMKNLGEILEAAGVDEDTVREMKDDLRSALGISAQELSLLASCLTRMGLTPADRSRVQATKKPAKAANEDPFDAEFAPPTAGRLANSRPN